MTETLVPYRFLVRGGTAAAVAALNEVVKARELVFETDTLKFKIGNGVDNYNDLLYVGELANLPDPGADHIVFWDDSVGEYAHLAIGANLTISGTPPTLDASGSGGGGVSSGTSNPGSPTTNDLFYRTDLDYLIVYDGAQWLTVQEFVLSPMPNIGFAGGTTANSVFWYMSIPDPTVYQLYLTRWECTTFVSTTNDGTRYWTVDLKSHTAANVTTSRDTFTTQSETPSNFINHSRALNLALPTTAKILSISNPVRTGATPGSILIFGRVYYRLIIT